MTSGYFINVLDLTTDELRKKFKEIGMEPYRADQVVEWIYEKGVYDFERMTNLSLTLREKLKTIFIISLPKIDHKERSSEDKSTKLLLRLNDNHLIEAVYIPTEKRLVGARRGSTPADQSRGTVCVSTQVGCKFHCAFCASGQGGFLRNLTMGEIISQVLLARDVAPDKKITHIVFMGIGEPFDNYKELLKTIRMLNSKSALGIGARKITISTCGLVPKIEEFSKEGLQIELSVSLHGATDSVRGALMPVNTAYPVKVLIDACKKYSQKTKRAITFEYILIKGVNAAENDATSLAKVLKGMLCKVNLIPYNSIEEFPHEAPTYQEIVDFQQILRRVGIKTTVRFSKGRDIRAACGQLRSKAMGRGAGKR